jgi:cytochrome b
MNTDTSTTLGAAAVAPSRRTVDAFMRVWHGLLALSFAGAYITADMEHLRLVHVVLGYTAGGLWLLRLLWGFVGPRSARWSALWGKLRGLGPWLAAVRSGPPNWRQAQNLLLACSVALVLLALLPTVVSGYATYMGLSGDWLEEVHEFFGNAMLLAVLAHVGGVLLLSLLQQRNVAAPMLSGRVPGRGPDLVRHNLGGLAALLLALVLAFWGWQWQAAIARRDAPEAPSGWLHPTGERTQSNGDDED